MSFEIKRENIDVFIGRNHPRTITVNKNGSPFDFISNPAPTTKLGIEINGIEYSSQDGFLSFADGGKVTFTLGAALTEPMKKSVGRLMLYNADYPNGNPIINEKTNYQITFTFRNKTI